MSSRLLKIFCILMICGGLFSLRAQAEEEKKAESGGEAKPAEKSEKKDEYAEAQARVAALQAKVRAGQDSIQKLIEEKQHTEDEDRVAEIVKEMVHEHKELQKNIQDYNKERAYLQYRFPEKGLKEDRVYERIEPKSLDQIENELTLESRIKKTLGKVRKQYAPPDAGKASTKDAKPARKKNEKNEPSISDPVILSK